MADQLSIYNAALRHLGERRLASLAEAREPRFLCDDVWNNDFINDVLSDGYWKFAIRAAVIEYDPNSTPPFGFRRAFTVPADALRFAAVSGDEFFQVPLTRYALEAGFIYADLDEIFTRYISNDGAYGGNLSAWPSTYTRYVEALMAWRIAPSLTKDQGRVDKMFALQKRLLTEAKNQDALDGPTEFPAQGSWARSRQGRYSYLDRGNRSQLIG